MKKSPTWNAETPPPAFSRMKASGTAVCLRIKRQVIVATCDDIACIHVDEACCNVLVDPLGAQPVEVDRNPAPAISESALNVRNSASSYSG